MNDFRPFRLAIVALIPAAMSLGIACAQAQSPSAPPSATPPAKTSPATPAPSVTPAPPPAESKSPADIPSTAQAPSAPPSGPSSVQAADPFGEQTALAPKTVVVIKGSANWDSAFDTLLGSFKTISSLLDKQGIKPAGNAMIV